MASEVMEKMFENIVQKLCPQSRCPPKQSKCSHRIFELYMSPCLECNTFCNCGFTYLPKKAYPAVMVRSRDKKIVRLSENLVRASITLSEMADKALKLKDTGRLREQEVVAVFQEDESIASDYKVTKNIQAAPPTPPPTPPLSTVDASPVQEEETKRNLAKVGVSLAFPPIRDTARKFKELKKAAVAATEKTVPIQELVDFDQGALALFDPDSTEPTLGISADILGKVDYFLNMHLDDVEGRVKKQIRDDSFWETTPYLNPLSPALNTRLEEVETRNPWRYEDWEESFFNVDTVTFFSIHQANQELLIYDLYYALEKWMYLSRGFPQTMVNGSYDLFNDPDFDQNETKGQVFGIGPTRIPNPYRTSGGRKKNSGYYRERAFANHRSVPRWWHIETRVEPPTDYSSST